MPLKNQALAGRLGKVDNIIMKFVRFLSYLSAICVVVIMCVAFFNVIGEKVFTTGIPNANEIVQYTHVPLVFLTAGFVTLDRGHTSVDLLSRKFPKGVRAFFTNMGFVLGAAICTFMGCRGCVLTGRYISNHMKSSTTGGGFLLWPFALVFSIGLFILAFTFAWSIVRYFAPKVDLPTEDDSGTKTDSGAEESAAAAEEVKEGGKA